MKSMKSIILVIAVVLIAGSMFAFKTEEQNKEYALLTVTFTIKKEIVLYQNNKEPLEYSRDSKSLFEVEQKSVNIINQLKTEGWEIISTDATSTGTGYNPVRFYHLERKKQ